MFVKGSFISSELYSSLNDLKNLTLFHFPIGFYILITLAKCFPDLRHSCMQFPQTGIHLTPAKKSGVFLYFKLQLE